MTKEIIEKHIESIKKLRAPSGLFLASSRGVSTGYDKVWLRDNFYTCLAFEETGDWENVKKTWRSLLDILLKHEYKISWAAENKPYESWQYIHARYHPETFEEFWEEWGNKQNDAVGAVLFKICDLEEKGKGIISEEGDKRITQKIVDYLKAVEYWHDPDCGMWEENEEIHASSVGAVLAGLKKADKLPFIEVPDYLIANGEKALLEILPRESQGKFVDLALLSLIYPYDVAGEMMADILKNVEYHLSKKMGIIRYKNDRYYNKNTDGYSEEAEWTMGFSWLSIIYHALGDKERSRYYFEKAKSVRTKEGLFPELYYSNSDMPNENIPLGWAESLFVIAANKQLQDI